MIIILLEMKISLKINKIIYMNIIKNKIINNKINFKPKDKVLIIIHLKIHQLIIICK